MFSIIAAIIFLLSFILILASATTTAFLSFPALASLGLFFLALDHINKIRFPR